MTFWVKLHTSNNNAFTTLKNEAFIASRQKPNELIIIIGGINELKLTKAF